MKNKQKLELCYYWKQWHILKNPEKYTIRGQNDLLEYYTYQINLLLFAAIAFFNFWTIR